MSMDNLIKQAQAEAPDLARQHIVESQAAPMPDPVDYESIFIKNFPDYDVREIRGHTVVTSTESDASTYGEILSLDDVIVVHGIDYNNNPSNIWRSVFSKCVEVNSLAASHLHRTPETRSFSEFVHMQHLPWEVLLKQFYQPKTDFPPSHLVVNGEAAALDRTVNMRSPLGWRHKSQRPLFEQEPPHDNPLKPDQEKSTWWHILYLPSGAMAEPIFRPVSPEVPDANLLSDAFRMIFSYFRNAVVKGISAELMSKQRLESLRDAKLSDIVSSSQAFHSVQPWDSR